MANPTSTSKLTTIPTLSYTPLTKALADLTANTEPWEAYDVIALMGPHGIGKSQWAKYVAKIWEIPVIIETMSGKEPTDIIGNPYVDGKVNATVLAPPSWFNRMESSLRDNEPLSQAWIDKLKPILDAVPLDRRPARILMMDEYNRVHPDTFGPMMNMVLTNEHHGKKMKSRTMIILAGNLNKGASDKYNINELDDAQNSRIREVEIQPVFEEWELVVSGTVHPGIVNYVRDSQANFNAFNKKGNLDLRSITRLGRRFRNMDMSDIQDRGFVIANLFMPTHQVQGLIQAVTAAATHLQFKDIFWNYAASQDRVKRMVKRKEVSLLNVMADKLYDALKDVETQGLDQAKREVVATNVVNFARDLNRPAVFKIVRELSEKVSDTSYPVVKTIMTKVAKDMHFRKLIRAAKKERAAK